MRPTACVDREPKLEALLFGELFGPARMEIERHLESCPGCRQALDDARVAFGALASVEAPPLPYEERERDPWTELRARLDGPPPPPAFPSYRFAAMAAVLAIGIGIGRLLAPTGAANVPELPGETASFSPEALEALERAEILADVGVRYVGGLRELLSRVTDASLGDLSAEEAALSRERARTLLGEGRFLARSLDPERDRLFLRAIARAEIFLEEVAALEPSAGERNVRLLRASLSGSELPRDLARLDLDAEVERALDASGGLGRDLPGSGSSRKDF